MTPLDELMALARRWKRWANEADRHSQTGASGILETCAADLRALLDSDAFRAMARDAGRYVTLRDALYSRNIEVGEAEIVMRIYGGCPDQSEFDAAIDAAASGARDRP